MLVIVSADKAVVFTLDRPSSTEIVLSAAVSTVNQTAVFVDFTQTGFADSALTHLANNIPSFLINNRFMSILETKLFFLWDLDGAFVLE